MREFERYWCEYVILGCPSNPILFFTKFLVKKGVHPTVYAENPPFIARILKLARFCVSHGLSSDETALELLLRHAYCHSSKKAVLLYTPSYSEFIKRNRGKLEKNFLLLNSEEIYEA